MQVGALHDCDVSGCPVFVCATHSVRRMRVSCDFMRMPRGFPWAGPAPLSTVCAADRAFSSQTSMATGFAVLCVCPRQSLRRCRPERRW